MLHRSIYKNEASFSLTHGAERVQSAGGTLIEVQFLGSGDAFGSGGRFQTCVLLSSADGQLLLDCGASSLIAMKRLGIDPSTIEAVVLTHLHGDHFAGIPFLILLMAAYYSDNSA